MVETSSNGQVALDGKEGQECPHTQDTLTGVSQVFGTHEDTDPESNPGEKIQSVQQKQHPKSPREDSPLKESSKSSSEEELPMDDPIGAGAPRLHQYRVHDGAEQAPMVKNILMMMDHFTRYALMVVTKDQTAKTVAKVFYERFIAVFGVPAKLLSNRGVNFTSTLVKELCATFGIQKYRTTAYHTQCNGQVEHFHQTLFRMIGKLVCDKKAQWV